METKSIEMLYQNTRGLRTKTQQFKQNILNNEFDLILITESWLCQSIYNGEICDDRYDIFRCDRHKGTSLKETGGGVMLCALKKLQVQHKQDWMCNGVESLWITLSLNKMNSYENKNLHIGLFYAPPDKMLPSRLEAITACIAQVILIHPHDHFFIAGDFNLSNTRWSENGPIQTSYSSASLLNAATDFLDMCNLNGLTQYNNILNSNNKILDLIFANIHINVSHSVSPLVMEDAHHPCLEISLPNLNIRTFRHKPISKPNFYKGDYEKINDHLLNINWNLALQAPTMDDVMDTFYTILYNLISEYIPSKNINSYKFPAWYTKALIHIIRDKKRAHKRWKTYNNPRDYDEFALLRTRQKSKQTECFDKYTLQMQEYMKKEPKLVFTYLNSLKHNKSSYPNTLIYEDNIYTEETEACNGFSRHFDSVFIKPASSYKNLNLQINNVNDSISGFIITECTVLKQLTMLNVSKGPGSDNIPPIFLKKCAKSLAKPLTIIFNLSINTFGCFPTKWKEALVVPIHKSGSKTLIKNYRPISILNVMSKIFEKIICDKISFNIKKCIPIEQHGFMQRRSTVTNLGVFTDYILKVMDEKDQVDVIYTDFEKAFDRVDHVILLRKLDVLGIHGNLLRWFSSYVKNRMQAVKMGSARSNFLNISSGVPQGSILGPLLYNAYLFDISNCFKHSRFLMFADDKKIFLRVRTIEDCKKVQADLDRLATYYETNRITINVNKCHHITFTRKIKPIDHTYNINGTTIGKVSSVRDLGITLDQKLTFSEHYEIIINKAYKQLGFIKRATFNFRNIECIKMLYFAYIRSVLEYASSIWSPYYKSDIQRIEKIQNVFVKYLQFKNYKVFDTDRDAYEYYHIETLESRRAQSDMKLLHAILNNKIDCPELLSNISLQVPKQRTRHTPLLYVPSTKTQYAKNTILTRSVKIYNEQYSDLDIFNLSEVVLKKEIKKKKKKKRSFAIKS